MVYEIVLGRSDAEREKIGLTGTILIGKQYVKMGQVTALSQPIYLDLNKAHCVFVCGKRGSGKSYSLGVIAEGISKLEQDLRNKLSVLILDTMGIYWTMKYPNHKEEVLLHEWGFEGAPIENVKIFTPVGFYREYKQKGIPTDSQFAIRPNELNPEDWNLAFELKSNDPIAVFIERIVLQLKKEKPNFSLDDIIKIIRDDVSENPYVRQAAENRFISVKSWGVFSEESTPLVELMKGGQITVLDLSCYAMMPNGWRIKHLALGIIANKMFMERMRVRKTEEFESIHSALHYISEDEKPSELPIVWMLLDEAHEFLPKDEKVASTDALVTLLREGRQPGIAMVLATQQPGKIHTDAMTQSDIILAHRLTAKIDTDALAALLQSYLRAGLDKELDALPRVAGSAIAVDDVNERMFPMRVRPRFSWHGGGAPELVGEKKKMFG
ncbi:MAG: ATP-binding protein [Candidatus Aenigmarchaeota archaeon]|nr:ATP-binding protein [Candidatus Aenigmarchaeota archaeon]